MSTHEADVPAVAPGALAALQLDALREIGNIGAGNAATSLSQMVGHPVGMSGTRVVLTLINELRRRGGGVGAAALCGGGGQGDAAIIRTL